MLKVLVVGVIDCITPVVLLIGVGKTYEHSVARVGKAYEYSVARVGKTFSGLCLGMVVWEKFLVVVCFYLG